MIADKNDAISCEVADAQAINDILYQETILFSLDSYLYSETVAGEGENNRRHVSEDASINSVVTFC